MAEEDFDLNSPEYLNWDSEEEATAKANDKVREAQKRRAVAYHDVFAKSDAGKNILTEWIQTFCTGPVAGRNATDREVAMNDGKRELINQILQQIQIGETL